jgi:hypothetical protein
MDACFKDLIAHEQQPVQRATRRTLIGKDRGGKNLVAYLPYRITNRFDERTDVDDNTRVEHVDSAPKDVPVLNGIPELKMRHLLLCSNSRNSPTCLVSAASRKPSSLPPPTTTRMMSIFSSGKWRNSRRTSSANISGLSV